MSLVTPFSNKEQDHSDLVVHLGENKQGDKTLTAFEL